MEVGITKTPKERPLPPLIRTSDVSHGAREGGSTMRIAPLPQTSRASNLLQRRRDKLRAVLALMDNSKIKKSVSRDRDRVMTIKKDALSLLVTDGREGGSLEAGPMWGRVRRGAIADGVLATRSQARERERSTLDKKPLVVRLRKFGKLHTLAKIIMILLRMCRTYILTENDAKMVKLFSVVDAAQAGDKYKVKGDLLFDVTTFRAKKQNNVSSETKRILELPTAERTEKDIHHVQVELQQMEFITKYPVHMQRGLIQTGAYESYETGRVIIRYGRRPYAFYLVLAGSALLLEGDPENSGRAVTALVKGQVFGNEAIVSRGRHNVTVISKEFIQLLSLTVEEYSRIFLAGGVSNISGVDGSSFIESVSIFKGWPLHLLKKHPKKCRFNFYTRGTVIETDSNRSDWIYILKSGSCAVLKKLHYEEPVPTKRKRNLPAIPQRARPSLTTNHEEQLTNKLREMQRKRAKALKGKSRRFGNSRTKIIVRIPMRDDPLATTDLVRKDEKTGVPNSLVPTILVSDPSRPSSSSGGYGAQTPMSVQAPLEEETTMDQGKDHVVEKGTVTSKNLKDSLSRGPFLTHTRRLPSVLKEPQVTSSEHEQERGKPHFESTRDEASTSQLSADQASLVSSQESKTYSTVDADDDLVEDQSAATRRIGRDTYVQIGTLEPGDIFGVSDMAFGKQPCLSLVSNGAECVLVAKKFYAKHATEGNMKTITDLLRPYPNEETLLRDLREKLTWQNHRAATLTDTAHNLRRYRRKLNDPGMRAPAATLNTAPV
ncbi:uncharacterized protein LOC117306916 [Asterias rubens]|uniref:uncharacterized protein LOC117306916 n=1 Tax=Asterias rubens TaxID=7604 RepID=UPI001454FADE|nr:uncharacterized protein LOC117306916 [Asterias rubens]